MQNSPPSLLAIDVFPPHACKWGFVAPREQANLLTGLQPAVPPNWRAKMYVHMLGQPPGGWGWGSFGGLSSPGMANGGERCSPAVLSSLTLKC
jgi:hypothetical protein